MNIQHNNFATCDTATRLRGESFSLRLPFLTDEQIKIAEGLQIKEVKLHQPSLRVANCFDYELYLENGQVVQMNGIDNRQFNNVDPELFRARVSLGLKIERINFTNDCYETHIQNKSDRTVLTLTTRYLEIRDSEQA